MSQIKLNLNKSCFLIIVLLVIGIFFRFVNLEKKIYWPDETFTSLRISGHTVQEAVEKLYDGRVISIADLHKYQTLNSDRNVSDTINGLAIEEPQQTPLYYILVRFWVQLFGESVALTRSFSAGISLLVFPAIYWLCRELFDCTLTAWVAIALIAISPFHVLYAQEARPYAFWTVTILISSAALLRAMRLKTQFSWSLYIVTLAISLYTFLLSGLVALSHGIYVLTREKFRLTKTVIAYLLA
ncbi:MAG: glycosyltransferase family 39 protein, partial [Phormidium sp.]